MNKFIKALKSYKLWVKIGCLHPTITFNIERNQWSSWASTPEQDLKDMYEEIILTHKKIDYDK